MIVHNPAHSVASSTLQLSLHWLLTHWGRDKMAAIFTKDIFKCIFINENIRVSIKISLEFVPKSPINNIPALVQIMAWHRPGGKPLSESMMCVDYWRIYASLGPSELRINCISSSENISSKVLESCLLSWRNIAKCKYMLVPSQMSTTLQGLSQKQLASTKVKHIYISVTLTARAT